MQQPQALRVTATRPFRMPELDDQKAVIGSKVVKPGDTLTVDRFLAGELISSGKALPVDESKPAPAVFRSGREKKE